MLPVKLAHGIRALSKLRDRAPVPPHAREGANSRDIAARLSLGPFWMLRLGEEGFRAAVETMRLPHQASPMTFVSVSMGVAQFDPSLNPSVQAWIEQADAALHDAKKSGRNRVVTERAKAA